MTIVSLILSLAVVGVILWFVNGYVPMQERVRRILNAVVIVCVLIWLLQSFGLMGSCHGLRIGP